MGIQTTHHSHVATMSFSQGLIRASRELTRCSLACNAVSVSAARRPQAFTRSLHLLRSSASARASTSTTIIINRTPSQSMANRRHASAVPNSQPTAVDPTDKEAEMELVKGIECMANNDVEGAGKAFTRSIQIKETPAALYNLALAHYQIGLLPACISAFERSIELMPSADAHTNVASAYILSTPPNAAKAIEHLQRAMEIEPNDGEINFNAGVIFEATDRLEDALREYNRASELGIERAAQCIRNVGGKILEKKRAATGGDASTSNSN